MSRRTSRSDAAVAQAVPHCLLQWLRSNATADTRIESLAGDVSPRRYFRIRHIRGASDTRIAVFYPPAIHQAYGRFLTSTALLAGAGVRVPEVLFRHAEQQLMIVEDLGARSLFDAELGACETERLYFVALEVAARIASLSQSQVAKLNPPLDAKLMRSELEQTLELYLADRVDGELRSDLEQLFDTICHELSSVALVPCHRDFMSRNLMLLAEDSGEDGVAVIDHQDLRLGPTAYDIASLLNDSVRLHPKQLLAAQSKAMTSESSSHYSRAAAQRCLKIVGTFCAFAKRGAPRYLSMVPVSIERALGHLAHVPEARELLPGLRAALWEPVHVVERSS